MMKRGVVAVLVAVMLVTSVNPEVAYAAAQDIPKAENAVSAEETDNEAAEEHEEDAAEDGQETPVQSEDEEKSEDGENQSEAPTGDESDGNASESEDAEQNTPDDAAEDSQEDASEAELSEDGEAEAEDEVALEAEEFALDGSTEPFGGGDGTQANPYLISTPDELMECWNIIKTTCTSPSNRKYVELAQDIILNESLNNPTRNLPSDVTFYGELDGKNHKIVNLYINDPDDDVEETGLFSKNGGIIKNLTIENARIDYAQEEAFHLNGGVIGVFAGSCILGKENYFNAEDQLEGSVENCTLTGKVSISGILTYTGGFVGSLGYGRVVNCQNLAEDFEIKNLKQYRNGYAGGLVGCVPGASTYTVNNGVENCRMGSPESECVFRAAESEVGGIVGYIYGNYAYTSYIKNCDNYATILPSIDYENGGRVLVGGIVSACDCLYTVSGCNNYGQIVMPEATPETRRESETVRVGGIAYKLEGTGTVSDCANVGILQCASAAGIAYLVKKTATVRNCANMGRLIFNAKTYEYLTMSGVVGEMYGGGTVINCYNAGSIENGTGRKLDNLFMSGVVGEIFFMDDNPISVEKCYSVGTMVTERDASMVKAGVVGGIYVGDNACTIKDCYSDITPVAANHRDDVDTSTCYKKKPAELQRQDTYAGWDFDTVWKMGEETYKYPILREMTVEPSNIPEEPGAESTEPDEADDVPKSHYTVTFNSRNGAKLLQVSYAAGEKIMKPFTPERLGYTFKGWYTEDTCTNLWDFENSTVWADIILYAGWNAEDELEEAPSSDQIAAGSADSLWMANVGTVTYTGAAIKPAVFVYYGTKKLRAGTDYTVKYTNNVKAGVGTGGIKVTGKGTYKTSTPLNTTFTINPKSIAGSAVEKTVTNAYAVNTKNTKNPTIVFKAKYGKKTLKNKTDYTLEVYDEDGTEKVESWYEAGTYTLKVKGKGNYTGTYSVKFAVKSGTPVSKLKVAKIPSQKYDNGNAIVPEPQIKFGKKVLEKGTDYTLEYRNNTEIGTATMTVTGKGDYFGSRQITFSITGISLKKVKFESWRKTMSYTGNYQTQNAVLTYGSGTNKVTLLDNDDLPYGHTGTGDYTIVSYENNKYVGTATVIYKGMGKYSGTVKKTFKIIPESLKYWSVISDIKVKGNIETGEGFDVRVTSNATRRVLAKDVDYKVNRTKKGKTVTVTVTGKGNYKDKLVKKYTIEQKSLELGFKLEDFKIADIPVKDVTSVGQIATRLEASHGYNENGYGYYDYKDGDYDGNKKLNDGDVVMLIYKGSPFISYDTCGDISIYSVVYHGDGVSAIEKIPCIQIPAGYNGGDSIDAVKALAAASPGGKQVSAVYTTEYGRVSVSTFGIGKDGTNSIETEVTLVFEDLDGLRMSFSYNEAVGKLYSCYINKASEISD